MCYPNRGNNVGAAVVMIIMGLCSTPAFAADPPCNGYPVAKQTRCVEIWKGLNKEDGPSIAAFGLVQQKRRDEGKINAEQHLAENMQFIRQSTERRLEQLRRRMTRE